MLLLLLLSTHYYYVSVLLDLLQDPNGLLRPLDGHEQMVVEIPAHGVHTDALLGQSGRKMGHEAHGLEAGVHVARDHPARVLVLVVVQRQLQPFGDVLPDNKSHAFSFAEEHSYIVQWNGERRDEL